MIEIESLCCGDEAAKYVVGVAAEDVRAEMLGHGCERLILRTIGRSQNNWRNARKHQPAQAVLEDRLPGNGSQRLAWQARRSQPGLEDDAGARPHQATSPMLGRASQTGRRKLASSRKNDVS